LFFTIKTNIYLHLWKKVETVITYQPFRHQITETLQGLALKITLLQNMKCSEKSSGVLKTHSTLDHMDLKYSCFGSNKFVGSKQKLQLGTFMQYA